MSDSNESYGGGMRHQMTSEQSDDQAKRSEATEQSEVIPQDQAHEKGKN